MPTGVVTVTVSNSPASCSAALVDGLGRCELALATPAAYPGATIFASSSGSETHIVVAAATWLYLPLIQK
jgi:hypothetical protein